MKYISVTLILLLSIGFAIAQSQQVITQIEVSKMSRAFEEHVRITTDSLHIYIVNRKSGDPQPVMTSRKLENGEWPKLVQSLGGISLQEISELPSPTMKRASDAAMHSTISITTKDGKSYEHGYDDENPNTALVPLLKEVRKVGGPSDKP